MVVATAGKLMGFYDGRLPTLITAIGYVVMGALIAREAAKAGGEAIGAESGKHGVRMVLLADDEDVLGLGVAVDVHHEDPVGQIDLVGGQD
mgnify:CR=1 FL=1